MVCEVLTYLKTTLRKTDLIFCKENTTLSCFSEDVAPDFGTVPTVELLFHVFLSMFMLPFIL